MYIYIYIHRSVHAWLSYLVPLSRDSLLILNRTHYRRCVSLSDSGSPSSHRRNAAPSSLPLSSFTRRHSASGACRGMRNRSRDLHALSSFSSSCSPYGSSPVLTVRVRFSVRSRNRFLSFLSRRPSRPFGTVRAADRVLPVFAGPLYLLSVARVPDRISKAARRAATIGALIAEGCSSAGTRIRGYV